MALIQCSECRREVSSQAPACPHCGMPIGAAAMAGAAPAGPAAVPAAFAAALGSTQPGAEQTLWEGSPSLKELLAGIVGTALVVTLLPLAVWFGFPIAVDFASGLSTDIQRWIEANHSRLSLGVMAAVGVAVALRVLHLVQRVMMLKSHHYTITNQRLVLETGVFSKRIDEIDMRTVDDLECRQSVMERLLGIGRVIVVSADRSAARVALIGVPRPRELRELMRGSAYQATRGQLFTRQT